ncbi:glycosyltransferase [Pontibacter qinzhouensis]|uniref:Glycosyltransferase n=1 Tax=Pontibacter qinzhouensis TaxID=2603253 RepID=A0A5C8KB17_9BACT|nr:glycosyltransferase [Pontibacter qinzhouensis]TXK49865.1 glycosyltransferase [Pontibacter qinzhouensis]
MPPKVSICMITYNHEPYIQQAVEGIMMQETNFDYELVIGEDCSTDKTREIVKNLKAKFPDKIKLLLPEHNLGMMKNFIETFQSCSGKYIALCEGDDYWTDTFKLQKQVDFLDQNAEFSISFHRVIQKNEVTGREELSNKGQKPISTLEDLFKKNFLCTASCVFRHGLFKECPDFFYNTGAGDWVLHMLNAAHGKIAYSDEVMAVYRIHTGGAIFNATSSYQNLKRALLKDVYTFSSINNYFGNRYNDLIKSKIADIYKAISLTDIRSGDKKEAKKNIYISLNYKFSLKTALLVLPLAYIPKSEHILLSISKLKSKLKGHS